MAETDWIEAREAAEMLGLSVRYFSEEFIFKTPSFPKAVQAAKRRRRRWYRQEIKDWIKNNRETTT